MAVTIGQVIALIKSLAGGGGGGGGGVSDVKVNGTSVVTNGTANIPVAGNDYGAVKISANLGVNVSNGYLCTSIPDRSLIKAGTNTFKPIVPSNQHESFFYAAAKAAGDTSQASSNNAVGVYTENAKSKISDMLTAPESVSGSTPSITAKSGVRYICGECSTLSVVAPESGCTDIVFESGSTATVLTVTSAKSGVSAIKWPSWFDPDNLDANVTYEINILDGEFGVVTSWA